MARKVFYSFHYAADGWRAAQIRNAGVIEGNQPLSDNDWESVTRGGDQAIKNWIKGQLSGKSCAVVLIGRQTAGRKWIDYEITEAWKAKKGVLGVYVHNLKDRLGNQSRKGTNPFAHFTIDISSAFGVGDKNAPFDSVVKAYDVPYTDSRMAYQAISRNLPAWVDEAIAIRARYR